MFPIRGRRYKSSANYRRLIVEVLEPRQLLTTLQLAPIADNTLFEDPSGSLSDALGPLFAGRTNQASNSLRRALLKFDLSSVPAGATINSVALSLNVSQSPSGSVAETATLHVLQKNWGEGTSTTGTAAGGRGATATSGDATWTANFFGSQNWATPGGDFVTTASASTSVGGIGGVQWTGAGLISDVNQWLATPQSNFGWIVVGDESRPQSARRFDSRESTTVSNRPSLTIDYTAAVPQTPAVTGVSPSLGPLAGGTSVTITGTNLAGATAVKFGTRTAAITSDTATQIVATSPAGAAGTVHVTVVTAGGTSLLSPADRFTYSARSSVAGMAPDGSWYLATSNGTSFVNQFWGAWNGSVAWKFVLVGDFNGDGKADIAGMAPDGSWYVAISNGTGFTTQFWGAWNGSITWKDVQVADVSGDGKADIVGRAPDGSWYAATSTGASFTTQFWGAWNGTLTWKNVLAGDFNGDGKADIAGMAPDGSWYLANSTGTAFVNQLWGAWNGSVVWKFVQAGDFNGDGKADIVGMSPDGSWWTAISTGAAFVNQRWGSWSNTINWSNVQVADVNGDGNTDIVGRAPDGTWWVALSTDSSFVNRLWGAWSTLNWNDVQVADVNGDGKADIVGRAPDGSWYVALSTGSSFTNQFWGAWNGSLTWRFVMAGAFTSS